MTALTSQKRYVNRELHPGIDGYRIFPKEYLLPFCEDDVSKLALCVECHLRARSDKPGKALSIIFSSAVL